LTALNAAEMELLLERMPEPAEDMDPKDDDELKSPAFRFNGETLELEYAYPDSVEVRIYDHAGKINLRNLTEDRLRALLERMLETEEDDADEDQIEELLAAWGDWLDADDGIRVDGAEEEYYLSLDPPYLPRQGQLETVEEILLIRGFDEIFGELNLNAAFTLYSESDLVNINTATVEALSLLPGLDTEAIAAVLAYRSEQDFTDFLELEDIVDEDDMAELQTWVDFTGVSDVYTILAVPKLDLGTPVSEDGEATRARRAGPAGRAEREGPAGRRPQPKYGGFAKTIRVTDYSARPFVLRIDPLPRLPLLN
jgi:general secretion pathway protein K